MDEILVKNFSKKNFKTLFEFSKNPTLQRSKPIIEKAIKLRYKNTTGKDAELDQINKAVKLTGMEGGRKRCRTKKRKKRKTRRKGKKSRRRRTKRRRKSRKRRKTKRRRKSRTKKAGTYSPLARALFTKKMQGKARRYGRELPQAPPAPPNLLDQMEGNTIPPRTPKKNRKREREFRNRVGDGQREPKAIKFYR